MRLKVYTEENVAEKKIEELLLKVDKDTLKTFLRKGFLYKGTNLRNGVILKSGKDVESRKFPKPVIKKLDEIFGNDNIWKVFTNGIFTSPLFHMASSEGEAKMFFPVGKFRFVWNGEINNFILDFEKIVLRKHIQRYVKDLKFLDTGKLEDLFVSENEEGVKNFFAKEIIPYYSDTGLDDAIFSMAEVVIRCKNFFLLSYSNRKVVETVIKRIIYS